MKKTTYPKGFYDFMVECVPGRSSSEIAEKANQEFNMSLTPNQIRDYMRHHDLRSGARPGARKEVFPAHIRDFILSTHTGFSANEMRDIVNHKFGTSYTQHQLCNFYSRNRLSPGVTGHYRIVPPSDSDKNLYEAVPCDSTTFFRVVPVGMTVMRGDGQLWTKERGRPVRWIPTGLIVLEMFCGVRVPYADKPYVTVEPIDGNPLNLSPSNLRLKKT